MKRERVLDLFCGCGGMSLGFQAGGFEIALAIDNWSDAIRTYNHNHSKPVGKVMDIKQLNDEQIDKLQELAKFKRKPKKINYKNFYKNNITKKTQRIYYPFTQLYKKENFLFLQYES